MPLIRKKERFRKGDLIVWYSIDFEEVEESIGSPLQVYPFCEVSVGIYQGVVLGNPHPFWVGLGTTEGLTFIRADERGSLYFEAKDYAGALFYPHPDQSKWSFLEVIDSELILGTVCGTLECSDPYEVRSYLKQVIQQYRPFFIEEMTLMLRDIWDEDEEI
jgi:hypothetical protein